MKAYLDLMQQILDKGTPKGDRTGTGTRDTFGLQFRHDLADGFPLLTTKKMFLRGVLEELLWMLSGSTNIKALQDQKVHIWDEWANAENGDLGPIYGHQWRNFGARHHSGPETSGRYTGGVDQIALLLQSLQNNPNSRRHIVTAWNPQDVPKQALPCCHCFFQCDVTEGKLNLQVYQRSADFFLGVPFNIASYALLTHMLAQVCGLEPGELITTYGSAHLYSNHLDQARLQLSREPKPLPTLLLNPEVNNLHAFTAGDFRVSGYEHHPKIAAAVSV